VIRAALLDLDGTLLDTAPDLAQAANRTLAELGLRELPESQVRDFIGQGVAVLVRRCLEASGGRTPDDALFESALARFAAHYERVNGSTSVPYPGVREGLAAMRAGGLRLACVTNKAARFAVPLLAARALDEYFDAVVTSDQAGSRKPSPGPFLVACERLGVSPDEAAAIGDSANDAQGARAAGCAPVLLVPYGYREGRDVRSIECDGIVASLFQAADVLLNRS
jgi:phosphoglycolate phosphatase